MSSSATPTPTTTKTDQKTVEKTEVTKETKEEEKPTTCVRSFFRSYLFYFFTVSAMTFSSYIVYRRMNKN